MSSSHTLVIEVSGNDVDGEGWDVDYSIECPGVTDACRMWVGCDIPDCPGNTGDDDTLYDVSNIAHGKPHKYIDDSWMVPTDTCYLIAADELPDAAEFLATKDGLVPGRYAVGHDFDDGRLADLHLAGSVTA
jgi:hypothetical protein